MKAVAQHKPSDEVTVNKELNKLDVAKLSRKKLERMNGLLKKAPLPSLVSGK